MIENGERFLFLRRTSGDTGPSRIRLKYGKTGMDERRRIMTGNEWKDVGRKLKKKIQNTYDRARFILG